MPPVTGRQRFGEPSSPAPESRITGLTAQDIYHFREGTLYRAFEKLGAHRDTVDGRDGTRFVVWAPNAKSVSVVGDFNDWSRDSHLMRPRTDETGIWELFIPGVPAGAVSQVPRSLAAG